MSGLDFGEALHLLLAGERVARRGWNAEHYLALQIPDANSQNTLPYIFMIVGANALHMNGDRVPWTASQTDLLSCDWYEVTT